LLEIADEIGVYMDRVAYRGLPMEQIIAIERGTERRRRKKAIEDLTRRRLVVVRSVAGHLHVGLTRAGSTRALREQIRGRTDRLPNGELCLVVFDIPVAANTSRRSLVAFLRTCGFKRLQLSVYATTRDIVDQMAAWISRSRIKAWVTVLRASVRA
jgi:hypothetical protein